jgi:hypothetical protein
MLAELSTVIVLVAVTVGLLVPVGDSVFVAVLDLVILPVEL